MTECVYIGLGGNLGDPLTEIAQALLALDALPGTQLTACSPPYRSAPLGPVDQPHYINAVAQIHTSLEPEALLDALQGIETIAGRIRSERWGARILDLDILLYGQRLLNTPRLHIPHPEMRQREFVLRPLSDIAPELCLPDGHSLAECLTICPDGSLQPLPAPPQWPSMMTRAN